MNVRVFRAFRGRKSTRSQKYTQHMQVHKIQRHARTIGGMVFFLSLGLQASVAAEQPTQQQEANFD